MEECTAGWPSIRTVTAADPLHGHASEHHGRSGVSKGKLASPLPVSSARPIGCSPGPAVRNHLQSIAIAVSGRSASLLRLDLIQKRPRFPSAGDMLAAAWARRDAFVTSQPASARDQ